MLDYRKKRQFRKTVYGVPVLLLLVCVLAFVGKGTWNLFSKYNDVRGKTIEVDAELVKLEAQKAEMQKRVGYLSTDFGKEEEIRNKFMVAKEGEGVIMVVDPKPVVVADEAVPTPNAWDRFLNFFR